LLGEKQKRRLTAVKRLVVLLLCGVLSIGAVFLPAMAQEKAPIKIGVIVELTGFGAEMGIESQQCVEVAMALKNAHGGIAGHPVELMIIDGQSDTVAFQSAAVRLSGENILAALGANDISFSQAAGAEFQKAGIVWIDCGGTTPTIPEIGDYNFMIPVPDNDQGRGVAAYTYKTLGYSTVAIFKDVGSAYGTELTNYFIQYFKEFTGKENPVPVVLPYQAGDVDYTSQLTRLQADAVRLGIQAIVLPTWPRDAPTIAVQARAMGIDLPLIGTDGVDTTALTEVGGPSVEGMVYSTHFNFENATTPAVGEFVGAFIGKYGFAPGAFGTMAFDAISVIIEALEKNITDMGDAAWSALSLSEKRALLRDTLLTGTFTSATQTIRFNSLRQPQRGLTWVVVRDGERHFLDFQPYEEYAE
jgi:branched-chain amino acid transport system substrate-binding protein